jgi:RNA polymerase sigma-70 factor, ECF subfamily
VTEPRRHDVTGLLVDLQRGRAGAVDELIPLVYDQLRSLAATYLRREQRGGTLQPTALVHEAFLRLVDQRTATWQNRAHFVGVAATLMRRILIDHARRRGAQKRGSNRIVTLDDNQPIETESEGVDVLQIDEALAELERMDSRQARVVELRFFGGLTIEETAELLGISPATVKREWLHAKAWLFRKLNEAQPASDAG